MTLFFSFIVISFFYLNLLQAMSPSRQSTHTPTTDKSFIFIGPNEEAEPKQPETCQSYFRWHLAQSEKSNQHLTLVRISDNDVKNIGQATFTTIVLPSLLTGYLLSFFKDLTYIDQIILYDIAPEEKSRYAQQIIAKVCKTSSQSAMAHLGYFSWVKEEDEAVFQAQGFKFYQDLSAELKNHPDGEEISKALELRRKEKCICMIKLSTEKPEDFPV